MALRRARAGHEVGEVDVWERDRGDAPALGLTAYRNVGASGEREGEVARASGRRDRFALFFSGAWEPVPRLRVTAGTRRDSIRDDFGRTAGGVFSREA